MHNSSKPCKCNPKPKPSNKHSILLPKTIPLQSIICSAAQTQGRDFSFLKTRSYISNNPYSLLISLLVTSAKMVIMFFMYASGQQPSGTSPNMRIHCSEARNIYNAFIFKKMQNAKLVAEYMKTCIFVLLVKCHNGLGIENCNIKAQKPINQQ